MADTRLVEGGHALGGINFITVALLVTPKREEKQYGSSSYMVRKFNSLQEALGICQLISL